MLVLYKRWKKYNEFQLTKIKMDLNTKKLKIIHPPPISHILSFPWERQYMKHETALSLYIPNQNSIINKIW